MSKQELLRKLSLTLVGITILTGIALSTFLDNSAWLSLSAVAIVIEFLVLVWIS